MQVYIWIRVCGKKGRRKKIKIRDKGKRIERMYLKERVLK